MNINLIWTAQHTIIDEHQSSEKVRTTKTWNENYPHLALRPGTREERRLEGENESLIVICGLKEPHVDVDGEYGENKGRSQVI